MFKMNFRQKRIIDDMEKLITVRIEGDSWLDAKNYIDMYTPAYNMVKYHTFKGWASHYKAKNIT